MDINIVSDVTQHLTPAEIALTLPIVISCSAGIIAAIIVLIKETFF